MSSNSEFCLGFNNLSSWCKSFSGKILLNDRDKHWDKRYNFSPENISLFLTNASLYLLTVQAPWPAALRHVAASIKCQKSEEETVQVDFGFSLLLFCSGSELFTFLRKYTHSVIWGCVSRHIAYLLSNTYTDSWVTVSYKHSLYVTQTVWREIILLAKCLNRGDFYCFLLLLLQFYAMNQNYFSFRITA